MGCRCLIGLVQDDSTVRFVYCHNGGNPGHSGTLLYENYDLPELLRLLEEGDLSLLGAKIGRKKDFDTYTRNYDMETSECLFYGR
ncbi:hypothetical protein KIPB_013004 [Kipferlia bialata]|uniref:Uncharacterized protein n=1 Tax=Kipferlia bialata TaxID=797122 RepID=A0A9K3D7A6_9EUKA|nr:hypothetical protein KIPB_013004 [Kipferlia bialata]|eukprot:g13004.t1